MRDETQSVAASGGAAPRVAPTRPIIRAAKQYTVVKLHPLLNLLERQLEPFGRGAPHHVTLGGLDMEAEVREACRRTRSRRGEGLLGSGWR